MISFSQRSLWLVGVVALAGMALAGCGDDDMPGADGGARDAGRDAGRDAAMLDSSMDDGGSGTCGDGEIGGDEECDDGDENSDTAADACRTDCTLAGCGDDVTDSDETCDGDDLGGRTCVDEEFVSGVLGCATDCAAYDTTMCSDEPGPVCGDDMIEGTEACDGDDLGGAMCPAGGTLACTATCTLDMSGCTTMTCGNDMAEGTEACDGTDLRGATCVSLGFTGGTLTCAECLYVDGACTSIATPTNAGQIVITEIMPNPAALSDNDGEWFELHNPGTTGLNLNGCVFTDGGTQTFTVATDVMVAAGGYVTFAATQATAGGLPRGFTPTYVYPAAYGLSNSADSIVMTCGGTMIDTVAYTGAFPSTAGSSMSLSPSMLTATANDDADNWCDATTTYGAGAMPDRGTPGAANDTCAAAAVWPVTYCRLQFPTTITTDIGTTTTVYGRVYAAGLTDMTDGTDVSTSLLAAVGYGPDGTDPATSTAWTWIPAVANTGWNDVADDNNDEYQAALVAPAPAGTYDYAYRFSGDSGATWLHCDLDGATTAAEYAPAQAGQLTSTTPPVVSCSVVVNEVQVAGATAADEFVELYNPCTTAVDLTGHRLVYRSAAGTTNTQLFTFPAATSIPAGEYRIYTGTAFPSTPASDGMISGGISATGGGVAVLNATMAIVDSMGFGTATNDFVEGTAAPAPAAGSSVARTPNGTDTDDNGVDFMVDATPTPRAPNL